MNSRARVPRRNRREVDESVTSQSAASLAPPQYGISLADTQDTAPQSTTSESFASQMSAPQSINQSSANSSTSSTVVSPITLAVNNTEGITSRPIAIEAPISAPIEPLTAPSESSISLDAELGTIAQSAPIVELLMPEPASELSATDQENLRTTSRRSSRETERQRELPAANDNVDQARGAVTEPIEETAARASAGIAEQLGEKAKPSPEIIELCNKIIKAIEDRRPPDEDSLLETDPREQAAAAGDSLQTSIEGQSDNVTQSYQALDNPPAGTVQLQPEGLVAPTAVSSSNLNATQAVPGAASSESVSLDGDVEASAQRMQDAGMQSESAQLAQGGPIAQARDAQGELVESAARDPAIVLAEQQVIRNGARADMAGLQEQALAALQASRNSTVTGLGSQQTSMVESEQQTRTRISQEAQTIFDDAQTLVRAQLEPLSRTALSRWDTGVDILATNFENDLARIKSWKDERHSGVGGFFNAIGDAVTGLPDWFFDAYDRAERNFGTGVCALLTEISIEVNSVIGVCELIIDNANAAIANLFSNLPEGLAQWALSEQTRFCEQLDSLQQEVTDTRDNFNQELMGKASESVQQVRETIHSLREAAGGLLGRIANAIAEFIDDPVRFIINGLLELVGISPAAFWALVSKIQSVMAEIADDPLGFANNLAAALGQGFQQFFDNFSTHVANGFFEWLFSGLGSVGVQIPGDLQPSSLITFFLQLMGITWENIREILARHIGEENVALLEQAYELIATLIEQGPEGIYEMLKEQLNPQAMLQAVMDAAIDYMVETLIKTVSTRVILMFNPAGALIQAIEVIYRILAWVFNNAARIFTLIETVVNGAAELIAGNYTGMATAIESALAGIVSPVIDFLAGLLGLGGLPDAIADVIRSFQQMVLGVVERVIAWLASRAKDLLSALGLGGEDEQSDTESIYGNQGTFNERDDGDKHNVILNHKGNGAELIIKSDPQTFETIVARRRSQLDASNSDYQEKISALDTAVQIKIELNNKIAQYAANLATDSPLVSISATLSEEIKAIISEISAQLAIVGIGEDVIDLQATHVKHTEIGGKASYVYANPLTRIPGNTSGSAPKSGQNPQGWEVIPADHKRFWVRAHLLNHQVHGPGVIWNLTPGTKVTNSAMLHKIESDVKAAVLNPDTSKYYYYEINISYHTDNGESYYQYFPKEISMKWGELIHINGDLVEDSSTEKTDSVTQELPEFPDLDKVAINESTARDLHNISKTGTGTTITEQVFDHIIVAKSATPGGKYTSLDNLLSVMEGYFQARGQLENYFISRYGNKLAVLLNASDPKIYLNIP